MRDAYDILCIRKITVPEPNKVSNQHLEHNSQGHGLQLSICYSLDSMLSQSFGAVPW